MSEKLRAFAIKLESNAPALLIIGWDGFCHTVAEKIRAHFHQQLFFDLLSSSRLRFRFNAIAWRHHLCAFSDLRNQPISLGMDKTEFQLRYLRQLLPRRRNLFRIEPGNLYKNPVAALWRDDRFAHAELIDTLPNHLDRLIKSIGVDRAFTFRGESDQERCAALQIKTEPDGFVRRIKCR